MQERLDYLKTLYRPDPDCIDSKFKCDFRVDDTDMCPCEWALTEEQKVKATKQQEAYNRYSKDLKELE